MFLGSRARMVRRADNLTAICEPTVYTRQCGILNISLTYRPPRPVTKIAFLISCSDIKFVVNTFLIEFKDQPTDQWTRYCVSVRARVTPIVVRDYPVFRVRGQPRPKSTLQRCHWSRSGPTCEICFPDVAKVRMRTVIIYSRAPT
jgi:hypothetical protein